MPSTGAADVRIEPKKSRKRHRQHPGDPPLPSALAQMTQRIAQIELTTTSAMRPPRLLKFSLPHWQQDERVKTAQIIRAVAAVKRVKPMPSPEWAETILMVE